MSFIKTNYPDGRNVQNSKLMKTRAISAVALTKRWDPIQVHTIVDKNYKSTIRKC